MCGVMKRAFCALALFGAACAPKVHPNDPGIPHALCAPRCEREHECDAGVSVTDCETRCERQMSPRIVYDREDLVAQMRDCALRQACTGNVDDGILSCQHDAFRKLEPTAAARNYCARALNKDASCRVWHDKREDFAHCIDSHKMYSDAILLQLDECNDDTCRGREMCALDVVGHDEVLEDETFRERRRTVPVESAGRATVSFHGVMSSETPRAPMAGVSVCLQGSHQCVTTKADGSYDLPIPSHAEVAVSFEAMGFETVVAPLTTAGRDVVDSFYLRALDSVRTHYSVVSATVPDPATGVVVVRALTMEDKPKGIEGVSFVIDGAPEKAPFYLQPDGAIAPDAKATSARGAVAFVGLAPGDVEVTATGPGVVCTPNFWAWPSQHANSVRAPIVAGATTIVVVQCHK